MVPVSQGDDGSFCNIWFSPGHLLDDLTPYHRRLSTKEHTGVRLIVLQL